MAASSSEPARQDAGQVVPGHEVARLVLDLLPQGGLRGLKIAPPDGLERPGLGLGGQPLALDAPLDALADLGLKSLPGITGTLGDGPRRQQPQGEHGNERRVPQV